MLRYAATAGLLLLVLSTGTHAELIVTEDGGTKEAYSLMLPGRGMAKDTVRKRFGYPIERISEVGTPPISKWRYDLFTVYFESDHVIHAVLNK